MALIDRPLVSYGYRRRPGPDSVRSVPRRRVLPRSQRAASRAMPQGQLPELAGHGRVCALPNRHFRSGQRYDRCSLSPLGFHSFLIASIACCSGAVQCSVCPQGSATTNNGTLFSLLPSLIAISSPGSTSCQDCGSGTYATADRTACTACPVGTYNGNNNFTVTPAHWVFFAHPWPFSTGCQMCPIKPTASRALWARTATAPASRSRFRAELAFSLPRLRRLSALG